MAARVRWRDKTAARGYGGEHQRLRAQWKPTVDAGQAWCHAAICLQPARWIQPGTPWHLGHTPDRTAWTGPEHALCNDADGGRRSRMHGRTRPWQTSRQW
jgi:hypothetical protein